MAKCLYVFLLFLLLAAPFAFASDDDLDDYGHNGYCRSLSGGFHGQCVAWRKGECSSVCKNVDHQDFGVCDWSTDGWGHLVCWCFHPCDK
ncbi:hypothetical protein SUGI_0916290 [Cryptomeria japonica]|nr:hypothetical protein SUGI_0916290 [Cryptomeria japonica]